MTTLATRGFWDPFAGLSDLVRWEPFEAEGRAFAPRFEVKETKDALILRADLPGVKTEDVDVSVHGNTLTLSGKREHEQQADGERYHMFERSFGSFTRSFTLPDDIDTKKLEAGLKDGVLTVTLPKAPEAKPQKIQIKAS